jgi:predicted DNA-binding ribbon-helix-helix protein
MNYQLNVKFVEVLANIIYEQNTQLIQIIAEEEKLNYRDLIKIIPTQYQIKKNMNCFVEEHYQRGLREKSNSTSETSVSSPSSEPDVE